MMHAPRTRVQRCPVHGVLLLDKPAGLSSNQALQKTKWLLRAEKAGHTGTLDPLATGVLPLCFGAATKFSQLHLQADKTYEATVRLGQTTATGDAEGPVLQEHPVECTKDQALHVLEQFRGSILQVPPMYSALKKDGKPLYEYARSGQSVSRQPRQVHIHELELLDFDAHAPQPHLRIRVRCSKGTYIRTLGQDIGQALGCGAHLSQLRRVRTGPFDLHQCTTLEALQAASPEQRLAGLLPIERLLTDHIPVQLQAQDASRFLTGMRRPGAWPNHEHVAVYGPAPSPHTPTMPAVLLGSAHTQGGELIPGRLLSPLEIQQILEPHP